MKTILNFLNKYTHAILWSVFYGVMVWGILRYLFNFDMFSAVHWAHVARARLHGFPGFVFGILVLAAVPLYIATTTVIVRHGPLFEYKYLKKIIALFSPVMQESDEPDPTPSDETNTPAPEPEAPKKIMPGEIVGAYAMARNHVSRMSSDFDMEKTMANKPDDIVADKVLVPEPVTPDGMPLPPDFDIGGDDGDNISPDFMPPDMGMDMSMPNFTDITFGEPSSTDTPSQPAETKKSAGKMDAFLTENNIKFTTTDDDIIITDKFAIATHDDEDFWVVDNESWFAAGKQKPSPAKAVMAAAAAHGVTPVLYFGSENIMDFEKHLGQWQSDGIFTIYEPENLMFL